MYTIVILPFERMIVITEQVLKEIKDLKVYSY
jgi:hypothetical protein